MSGSSDVAKCPECDGENLFVSMDWKPIDLVEGVCVDCGFHYETVTGHYRLSTVNSIRKDYDLKPIKQLRKRARKI